MAAGRRPNREGLGGHVLLYTVSTLLLGLPKGSLALKYVLNLIQKSWGVLYVIDFPSFSVLQCSLLRGKVQTGLLNSPYLFIKIS